MAFMEWQFTPFALIYFGAALVSIAVAAIARRRRSVPGARALSTLMAAVALWALCDGLESGLGGQFGDGFGQRGLRIGIGALACQRG